MTEVRSTVCNRDCPDACGILATVEDGVVTRLQGDPNHPVTRGFLCHRTGQYLSTQYNPERITRPLLRKGGELVPVSWDEALGFLAERLLAIRAESGPEAIFHYQSGGTLGILAMAVVELFFDRFGPVTTKRGDICSGAGDAAQELDFGEGDSHDLFDLLNSRQILVWGKNPYVSSPHLIPVLKDARKKGARIVLVDPVYHRTAELAEQYWQPRPAGDFALAMAVARVLVDSGRVHPDAASWCDHLDAFVAMARSRSVEEWCRDADVPVDAAEDLAGRLTDGPTAILVGWGMGRRGNGGGIVRALDALGAISGNLGIPGGGVSFYFKRRGAFRRPEATRPPPRTICEPLFGPEILAADPPIRAVWVTAGNPVAMLPESNTVHRALSTRELLVVADAFLTDTARLAHVVLPTPTLLEADDLLGSYGHHWLGAARPVVQPPPEVKSDVEIVSALAARVGLGDLFSADVRTWKERCLSPLLAERGVTLETLEAGPVRNPLAAPVLWPDRKFPTPSGRVNLMTSPPPDIPATPGYPLWLFSLSTEHSQSAQWARPQEGPAVATVHPDVGVADGALARLISPVASMTVRVRHDARQRRDVVLVPKGGHLGAGRAANALVEARTTDIGEGGALYDQHVRIEAV